MFFSNLLILYFLINWLPSVLQQTGLPIERAIIGTVLLNAGGTACVEDRRTRHAADKELFRFKR